MSNFSSLDGVAGAAGLASSFFFNAFMPLTTMKMQNAKMTKLMRMVTKLP